jgi:hypothetical protein
MIQADRKRMAVGFRALAKEFGRLGQGVPARSMEDTALDYHDAAQRAGALLVVAYRAGLLAKIPGLARLIGRRMDEARLFKQFHGYEVNVGVLLSGRPGSPPPRDAAMTCGLLPQLLPDDPVFRGRTYSGKNADKQALRTELRRAAKACKWLAERIVAATSEQPPAAKGRSGKKATPAARTGAKTPRKRTTKPAKRRSQTARRSTP